jgi:hypothetical protein
MSTQIEKARKQRGKIWPVVVQVIIGAALGFAGGVHIVGKLFSGQWSVGQVLLFVLGIFLALFVHINMHEFGHFVFGKLAGYRLISYRIGFLAWNCENGKMKFSIIPNKSYSGLCAMVPPEHELPSYKNVMYYAGGLLANVLVSAMALFVVAWYPGLPAEAKTLLTGMAALGLALAAINVLPFTTQNTPTDGKILWSMLLNRPFARQLIDVQKMMTQLSAGIRPRDIQAPELADTSDIAGFELISLIYLYFKALDSNNREMVLYYAKICEQNLDRIPHHLLPSFYYELCFVGCITGDKEKATVYHNKAGKILQSDKDVNGLRVKAYYECYVNDNSMLAKELCTRALSVVDKFPLKGQAVMERELVEKLLEVLPC